MVLGSHCAAQSAIHNNAGGRLSHSRSYTGFTSGVGRPDDRQNSSQERSIFSRFGLILANYAESIFLCCSLYRSLDRELDPNVAREAVAMNMALSTLLLHDIRHRRCPVSETRPRPSTLLPSGMPEIQEDEEDTQASNTAAAAAALDRAIHNLSSNRNMDYSSL